jgi:transcriptional regulator with XRE-family HTH domain
VDLANHSGATQSMISKIESDSADNVSIDVLRKHAKALNCALIDLLPMEYKRK